MSSRERDVIKLTPEQHQNLCMEEYLEIDGKEIPIEKIDVEHIDSGRHQEYFYMVFKVKETGKYYRVRYSTSIKDSMGWSECNWDKEYTAREVFPKIVTNTIFE